MSAPREGAIWPLAVCSLESLPVPAQTKLPQPRPRSRDDHRRKLASTDTAGGGGERAGGQGGARWGATGVVSGKVGLDV